MGAHRILDRLDLVSYVRSKCEACDGCLIWRGRMSSGVPRMALTGSKEHSPRQVLWRAAGKRVVKGYQFQTPECDARCVEPSHQRYRSAAALLRERIKQGRMFTELHRVRCMLKRKETRKYTEEQIAALRARYAEVNDAARAGRELGFNPRVAWAICTGRRWKQSTPFSGLAR